jgi:hypothetical protein
MSDIDRIYQLFAEADPAPTTAAHTIERPDADAILQEQRKPIMLTKEPRTIQAQPSPPPLRRWRGPAIAVVSFIGVVALGVAGWLLMSDNEPDAAATTAPPTAVTTTTTTTTLPPVVPGAVSVPDLKDMSLAEARALLEDIGLEIVALPDDIEFGSVFAQDPPAGGEVEAGSAVTVDVRVIPTCNPPDPLAPGPGEVIISVFFECGNEGFYPTEGIGVPRIVVEPETTLDRIELVLRSMLAGPTNDERGVGVTSFFDASTGAALNSVTFSDGHVVADFNDAILVNNASTSTGSMFFNAELQRNMFMIPEVDSVEFHINGSCEAWSAFFQSDGCWVITRADWDQSLADWAATDNS